MTKQSALQSTSEDPGRDRILGGLEYLQQCLEQKRPFAVITGNVGSGRRAIIQRFLEQQGDNHVAHLAEPTRDPHRFLESILIEFGLEPIDCSTKELRRLVSVFLEYETAEGRPAVVVVEDAHYYGPLVLETIQRLAVPDDDEEPAALFILTGTEALHRVLDSTGMLAVAPLTHDRLCLDQATKERFTLAQPEPLDGHLAELIVSLDADIVCRYPLDREQLLIGRNEHNDVPIVSRYVSRHHALLINRPEGGSYIVDLKSTNGTFVNSVRVTHEALRDGDVISIGNFRLKFVNPAIPHVEGLAGTSPESFSETVVMRSSQGIGAGGEPELEPVPDTASDSQTG